MANGLLCSLTTPGSSHRVYVVRIAPTTFSTSARFPMLWANLSTPDRGSCPASARREATFPNGILRDTHRTESKDLRSMDRPVERFPSFSASAPTRRIGPSAASRRRGVQAGFLNERLFLLGDVLHPSRIARCGPTTQEER